MHSSILEPCSFFVHWVETRWQSPIRIRWDFHLRLVACVLVCVCARPPSLFCRTRFRTLKKHRLKRMNGDLRQQRISEEAIREPPRHTALAQHTNRIVPLTREKQVSRQWKLSGSMTPRTPYKRERSIWARTERATDGSRCGELNCGFLKCSNLHVEHVPVGVFNYAARGHRSLLCHSIYL